MPDTKGAYLPKNLDKQLLPITHPATRPVVLRMKVNIVASNILIPVILAPIPTPTLFIVRAKARNIDSLTSI